jgi:putative membrane protein
MPMKQFVLALYPWIKALHLISVIAWMAGLLYLPRLFVYHCAAAPGSTQSETFKVMERRLIRAIMNPAMIATWLFGFLLLWVQDWSQGWLHAKLVLVFVLTGMHHVFSRWRKAFERDANSHPARTFRIANEVPTILMIAIVILVIVKPF